MFKTIKKHLKKVYAISFALTLFVVGSAIAASTNDGNMHTLYVTDKSLSSSDWSTSTNIDSSEKLAFELHYYLKEGVSAKNMKFLLDNINNKTYNKGDIITVKGRISADNLSASNGSVTVKFDEKVKLQLYNVSWQKWPCQSVGCETSLIDNYSKVLTSGMTIGDVDGSDSHYSGNVIVEFKVTKVNDAPAPINGGWTNWTIDHYGSYGACTNGQKTRNVYYKRSCTNPAPANGGKYCSGDSIRVETESEVCTTPTPIDGGWTSWTIDYYGSYGECVNGQKTRNVYYKRSCTNPAPANGGKYCSGDSSRTGTQTRECESSIVDANVYTNPATNIHTTSAQLNGRVEVNDTENAKVYFVYGTSASNMNKKTSYLSVSNDTLFQAITGLNSGTRYYFQAIVRDNDGIVDKGIIRSFTTKTVTPVVVSGRCGWKANTCAKGYFVNVRDTASYIKWNCVGYNGGNTAACAIKKVNTTTHPPVVVSKPLEITIKNETTVTTTKKYYEERGLEITKTVGRSRTGIFGLSTTAKAGDTVFYKIRVKNNSDEIVDVKVEDFIPAELDDKDNTTADSDRYMTWVLKMNPGETKVFLKELVVDDTVIKGQIIESAAKVTVDDKTEETNSVEVIIDGDNFGTGNDNSASIFGANSSFFPTSIVGWLAVLLLVLGVLFLGTKIFTTAARRD